MRKGQRRKETAAERELRLEYERASDVAVREIMVTNPKTHKRERHVVPVMRLPTNDGRVGPEHIGPAAASRRGAKC